MDSLLDSALEEEAGPQPRPPPLAPMLGHQRAEGSRGAADCLPSGEGLTTAYPSQQPEPQLLSGPSLCSENEASTRRSWILFLLPLHNLQT